MAEARVRLLLRDRVAHDGHFIFRPPTSLLTGLLFAALLDSDLTALQLVDFIKRRRDFK